MSRPVVDGRLFAEQQHKWASAQARAKITYSATLTFAITLYVPRLPKLLRASLVKPSDCVRHRQRRHVRCTKKEHTTTHLCRCLSVSHKGVTTRAPERRDDCVSSIQMTCGGFQVPRLAQTSKSNDRNTPYRSSIEYHDRQVVSQSVSQSVR